MEHVDITGKVKNFIRFGLVGLLILSGAIGYGMFRHYHAEKILQIENAKVTGNMISIHAFANGKIQELPFSDGEEVKAGDVIAKIEVSVTEEDIKKLQQNLDLAKKNYESLKLGQRVKTPVRRTKPVASPAPKTSSNKNVASIATLEERARRMDELYEMGAVSSKERDKAREDLAKARVSSAQNPSPAPQSSGQTVEIDFVDSIQPTPPAILQNAENAVKEAEIALNSAVEQSKQTEITAPVDGTIYNSFKVGEEVKSGDLIAKIGDEKNIWIEAEVSEEIFNQVALGKKVSYSIDGHNISGTVTEKISPQPEVPETPPENNSEIVQNNSEQNNSEVTAENLSNAEKNAPQQNNSVVPPENNSEQSAENNSDKNNPEQNNSEKNISEENNPKTETEPKPQKFILKVSIPDDRDYTLKLLSETTLKISL